jgi:hypothetical protein
MGWTIAAWMAAVQAIVMPGPYFHYPVQNVVGGGGGI